MKTIWKFEIELSGSQPLFAPDVRIISAGLDPNGVLCVWGTVDTDKPQRQIEVAVCGTGGTLPQHPLEFVGTVKDGPFMWHVFASRCASP
ncbi:hypothetical protein ASE05_16110 [Mesorhizobium sp. Root172]|nr:hypothetical protein ASE05_16110 [Mesorhizobium sp. Root172]